MVFSSAKLFLQIVVSIALFLALIFLVFNLPLKVDAQVAVFYPATCSGGWKYASQASGLPEVSFGIAYSGSNSAILEDVLTELKCGSFAGELPIQSKHTKVTLHFSWDEESTWDLVEEDIVEIENGPEEEVFLEDETEGNEGATSNQESDSLLATSSIASTTLTSIIESNTPFATTTPSEATSSEVIILPEPMPVPEPESAPEVKTPLPPEAVLPLPEVIIIPEVSEPVSWWQNLLIPNVMAEELEVPMTSQEREGVSTVEVEPEAQVRTEEVVAKEIELDNSSAVPAGARFEVRYSLDNKNWVSLGYVSEISNDLRFVFPEEVFRSIVDIEKVQVALVTLPQIDGFNRVYLDAMWLEVEYEKVLELGVYTVLTEPLTTFSALPTFIVGSSTSTSSDGSVSNDVLTVADPEVALVQAELSTTTATTTPDSLFIYTDEVSSIKGISDNLVLLTLTTSTSTELWLIDLIKVNSTLIGTGETAVSTYPVASKDSIIFWRGVSGDKIFSYDLRTGGTLGQTMIVANLPEQTDFPRFSFPFTQWEVIMGNDRFNFYSNRTGEVFSDEDTTGVRQFIVATGLDKLGTASYFENLGIYFITMESASEPITSI